MRDDVPSLALTFFSYLISFAVYEKLIISSTKISDRRSASRRKKLRRNVENFLRVGNFESEDKYGKLISHLILNKAYFLV